MPKKKRISLNAGMAGLRIPNMKPSYAAIDAKAGRELAEALLARSGRKDTGVNEHMFHLMRFSVLCQAHFIAGEERLMQKCPERSTVGTVMKSIAEDAGEMAGPRMERALKCLNRKNLMPRSIKDMCRAASKSGSHQLCGCMSLIESYIGGMWVGEDGAYIPDEAYVFGIEMAMYANEPDVLMSDKSLNPYLEKYLPEIWAWTAMAYYSKDLIQKTSEVASRLDETEAATMEYGGIAPALELLSMDKDEIQKAAQKEARTAVKAIARKALEEKSRLQARIDELQKQIRPMSEKIENLEAQKEASLSESGKLRACISGLEAAMDGKDALIAELVRGLEAARGSEQEHPALPEEGVMFVGGHESLAYEIARRHPGWRVVGADDASLKAFAQPKCVVLYTEHVSHKAWKHVRSRLDPKVPVIIVRSRNIDALESEMRAGWAAARRCDA